MSARKIRVLFVSNQLSIGGAERFVSNSLVLLDKAVFELHLALFRNDIVYNLPEEAELHMIHKYRKTDIPKAIWRLKQLIDRLKPDVVLSPHSGINHFVGEAVGLARHKPFWIARIAISPEFENRGLYGAWSRRIHRKANLVLVNAQSMRRSTEDLLQVTAEKIRCIHNPTHFAAIDQRSQEKLEISLGPKPLILAIGRLEREKRFDLLLDAFATVRKSIDCQLVILGEGRLRHDLETQSKRLGLQSDVRFPGFVQNPYAIIPKAVLFVLSSDFEGLPNALIETQGMGLPAVATDCANGPNEIVDHNETGLLVPTGSADRLSEAIIALLSNPDRRERMGQAAFRTARQRFDSTVLVSELTHAIKSGADANRLT